MATGEVSRVNYMEKRRLDEGVEVKFQDIQSFYGDQGTLIIMLDHRVWDPVNETWIWTFGKGFCL